MHKERFYLWSSVKRVTNRLSVDFSHVLSAVRVRISSSRMIRRRRRLTASSSLGGDGGIHGMLVGTSVALITRSITAARTAYVVFKCQQVHY